MENPAFADLREMEVLRFLLELKRDQMEPNIIQQEQIERKIQEDLKVIASESVNQSEASSSLSSPEPTASHTIKKPPRRASSYLYNPFPYSMIPDPILVFRYASQAQNAQPPVFPTPTPTPEPIELPDPMPIDYSKTSIDKSGFELSDRSQFINLKKDDSNKIVSPPTPTTSSRDSDSDHENDSSKTKLNKLVAAPMIENWCGSSIYNNLPELVMTEYDKILRESHSLKVEVITKLNSEYPVSYDFNPKKSRVRTNYLDRKVAESRTLNNIASRRSRQRKKFQTQMIQYSVDYDKDENFLLAKQEKWLRGIIEKLEQKAITSENGYVKIKKLRKQCGFE